MLDICKTTFCRVCGLPVTFFRWRPRPRLCDVCRAEREVEERMLEAVIAKRKGSVGTGDAK